MEQDLGAVLAAPLDENVFSVDSQNHNSSIRDNSCNSRA